MLCSPKPPRSSLIFKNVLKTLSFLQVAKEDDEPRRLTLEKCGRKYWTIFVDWSRITRLEKEDREDAVVEQLQRYLAMKSLKELEFNL